MLQTLPLGTGYFPTLSNLSQDLLFQAHHIWMRGMRSYIHLESFLELEESFQDYQALQLLTEIFDKSEVQFYHWHYKFCNIHFFINSLSKYKLYQSLYFSKSYKVCDTFVITSTEFLSASVLMSASLSFEYGSVSISKVSLLTFHSLNSSLNVSTGFPFTTKRREPSNFKLLSRSFKLWIRNLHLLGPDLVNHGSNMKIGRNS